MSGDVATTTFGKGYKRRDLDFQFVPQEHVLEEYAGGPPARTPAELAREYSWSLGNPMRVYDDDSTIAAGTGFTEYRARDEVELERNTTWDWRWDVRFSLRRTV